ncbi:MAG: hypothetical protein U9N78_03860, partial [Actinomycetota bacterium]|nr:hypothetical protein [Actinomycetota bacterium]
MSTEDDHSPEDGTSRDDSATSSESPAAVEGFESTDAPLEPFGEVLSGVMDPHDPDATGELDLPDVNETPNPHPADADPGFDGWLDDDEISAKTGDPYASLSDAEDEEDAASEIADWMAFTSAAADEPVIADEAEVIVDVTDTVVSEEDTADDENADSVEDDAEEFADEAGDRDEEDLPFVRITEPEADEPHEDTVELVLGDAATEHDDAEDDDPMNDSADGESQDLVGDEPSEEIFAVEGSLEDPDEDDPEKLAVLPIVPI